MLALAEQLEAMAVAVEAGKVKLFFPSASQKFGVLGTP
jgi:hypothetical protein